MRVLTPLLVCLFTLACGAGPRPAAASQAAPTRIVSTAAGLTGSCLDPLACGACGAGPRPAAASQAAPTRIVSTAAGLTGDCLDPLACGACGAGPRPAAASQAAPTRIVSTAPSLTEALYALGLGSSVAGVTDYCLYPPEASSKPKIGTFLQPSLERILALKPDLVLTIRNPVQLTEKLRRLGLRTEEFNEDTTADVFSALHKLGELTSRQAEALKITASISKDFDFVRASAASLPKRRVLFLVGRSPGTFQGMYGAGARTFIDELMSMAGGVNVLASLGQQYPKVSVEQILSFDPDVILDMGNLDHAAGRPLQPESEVLKLWAQYPQLRAVRGKRVRVVAGEIYIRPGPRMGQAARAYLRLIQGIQ